VRLEVGGAFLGVRPARAMEQGLASELVGHPEAFGGAQPAHTFTPVRVLGTASAVPIATDQLPDATGDHLVILTPQLT
jgi:hypothetical protein